jgi:hypothetical protein
MIRLSTTSLLTLLLAAVSLPRAANAGTAISGVVKNKAGKPRSGIALTEKGEIHNNIWYRGARVDAKGRFTIELEEGGPYGLHVYSSGYIYSPQAVLVEPGKTVEVTVTLVPEPTRANDPIIKKVSFSQGDASQGKVTLVKMDVSDPNGILGPQVMAFNAATGRVYAMDPPTPVKDLKADFPQGVYQIAVNTTQGPINRRDWYFVVADHQCEALHVVRPETVIAGTGKASALSGPGSHAAGAWVGHGSAPGLRISCVPWRSRIHCGARHAFTASCSSSASKSRSAPLPGSCRIARSHPLRPGARSSRATSLTSSPSTSSLCRLRPSGCSTFLWSCCIIADASYTST